MLSSPAAQRSNPAAKCLHGSLQYKSPFCLQLTSQRIRPSWALLFALLHSVLAWPAVSTLLAFSANCFAFARRSLRSRGLCSLHARTERCCPTAYAVARFQRTLCTCPGARSSTPQLVPCTEHTVLLFSFESDSLSLHFSKASACALRPIVTGFALRSPPWLPTKFTPGP